MHDQAWSQIPRGRRLHMDLSGSTLMVSGGTGSFGSTIVRHFLTLPVAEMQIFSRDEKKQEDMRQRFSDSRIKFILATCGTREPLKCVTRGVDFMFPRRGAEAGAVLRILPDGSRAHQHSRHRERNRRCDPQQCRRVVCLSHRQSGLSDQCDGHVQGDDGEGDGREVAARSTARTDDLRLRATAMSWVRADRCIPLFVEQVPLASRSPSPTRR